MPSDGTSFFESLDFELRLRAARATVSQLGVNRKSLRAQLLASLAGHPDAEGSVIADPLFENMFDWESENRPIQDLGLFSSTLLAEIAKAHGEADALFPARRIPYKHQVVAWQSLMGDKARSCLIRTGTASGKTETFLIPILDDLSRELSRAPQHALVGVRALFLYPLNALINSQKERLLAGTAGYGSHMRFCLYNGNTPETSTSSGGGSGPEIRDRRRLRSEPPPILVTNASMLEYMLVRKADQPILDKSAGKLRWVVLDEAHSYLGSAAAELSLLIRRVLTAFGVTPDSVRFVATSATIGGKDEKAEGELRRLLADIAGVNEESVDVVSGSRVPPALPSIESLGKSAELDVSTLRRLHPSERAKALSDLPAFREARRRISEGVLALPEIQSILGLPSREDTLQLLDLSTDPAVKIEGKAILPLRSHFFHRTQPGLWACTNSACDGMSPELTQDKGWPFGRVVFSRRERCPDCHGMVGELILCTQCGEPYIFAVDRLGDLASVWWTPPQRRRWCPWMQRRASGGDEVSRLSSRAGQSSWC